MRFAASLCSAGFACMLLLGIIPREAYAQSMQDRISQLGIKELARDYLAPGADALGTTLNSGFFQTAKIRKGFHVRISVNAMWTYVPSDATDFTSSLPASLRTEGYPGSVTSATIFGDNGAVLSSSKLMPTGEPYPDIYLPDGLNMKNVFFAFPQLTIGSFAASEIILRGMPATTYNNAISQVRFFGYGIRHSPSQYIRRLPFDISFMAAIQHFSVGDFLDVKTQSYSGIVSKSLRFLTLFGGISYELYDIQVNYTYTPSVSNLPPELLTPQTIDPQFTNSTVRYTIGATLTLIPFIDVAAAYSFGTHQNVTITAGLGF